MQMTPTRPEDTVIGQVLAKFVAADPQMFALIAEDVDFRIDHFRDETDVSWQRAATRDELVEVVTRLGTEVFPRGTRALSLETFALGDGWVLTFFHQRFFYGVRGREVDSRTVILSHEAEGLLDFFRETVRGIEDL
ncbi:hypothetical protein ACQ5SO_11650 [Rhodovulum sp. DZ06]|uniref:hypothetical protein n=1 Tax=Rhodovulum sp. DZ06 TaxID=3425126 RepID=UPI003D328D94